MSTLPVSALTFDVFGTVVDWRPSVARELRSALEPRGGQLDWVALADEWRAAYQPALEAVRSGARSWTTLDVLHEEMLTQLLDRHGIDRFEAADIAELARAWHRLDPWPDTVPGLTRLAARYPLATLSNGNVALMVGLARHARLPWDAILGAEFSRTYKTQPATYLCTAKALGLPPERCLMVAAHNDDLRAAAGCGFRTALVLRPLEHGPAQTTDLQADGDWDIVAADLLDLAQQLGC